MKEVIIVTPHLATQADTFVVDTTQYGFSKSGVFAVFGCAQSGNNCYFSGEPFQLAVCTASGVLTITAANAGTGRRVYRILGASN
jgi:hypothetical protein